ncbi:LEM domain-containing protein 1 isoform X1 [Sminthopsis crassicaudata]|uniref:LEM domain-containing protein 1 isoform X1 n=2 Tax=Sminthopsis crassicaudata TaxID=9301 RepID=UPI003D6816C5
MTKGASQVSIGMVDIKCLTDNELQQQLINHGYNPGPIIPSTRQVYEDKLQELITQHKAKKKSEELNKDLECVGDKENLDDHILERAITTSSRRSKQCKKDSCALEKPAKQKSFELQQCASPLLQRGRKLSSDYTSDGDVDIFYADPCSHTGIRITIRRPLNTKTEDPQRQKMLEDMKTVEKKVGVISIAFIITVLLIFAFIIFVYLTMEKKVAG